MGVALGMVLVAGVVALVARPLWSPALEPVDEIAGPASEIAALEERKEAIYGSIRDLGFDYRTDKLVEEDYRREVAQLKADAIEVVARIEELRSSPPRADDAVEARIAELRRRMAPGGGETGAVEAGVPDGGATTEAGRFCTQCGHRTGAEDRFCAACGHRLPGRS